MKKIFSTALAFALAFSAVSAVSAQSMTNAFNTNLKLGARGADVVALQSFLESKGLLTMPAGVAKGYFGGLTKSAVVAYQISKGVTPASGYFGPLTRATANADTTTVTTGTTTTTTTTTTGTTATTGTTGTVSTSGVEGTLDTTLAATPANNANVQTQTDVPVYGVQFRARVADSVVQTLDLQVAVSPDNGATFENPATLINTIKVWDGSNVIATIPVSSTTFVKDSNQVYYIRLSGLNFLVAKDATKVLTVSFSTNSIDTSRSVTIDGYGTSSIRAVSGNGISSFYSVDGSAYTRIHTFKKPGTSTLTLSSAASPLRSQNFRINPDNGAQYVPVLNFNLKSDTGDSNLQQIVVSLATTTNASTLYLYDGSTLIDSMNATNAATVTFNNLDNKVIVSAGTTKTLTLKADFPTNSVNGGFLTATVTSVTYQKPNGTSGTLTTAVAGVPQYVFNNAAQWALAGTPTITKVSNQNGSTTEMSATFTFNVTALGSTIRKPIASDFWIDATTGAVSASSSVGAPVVIPNNDIADGSTAQVSVTATVNTVPSAGSYAFVISKLTWASTTGSNVNQTWGLDDFKTPSTAFFNK